MKKLLVGVVILASLYILLLALAALGYGPIYQARKAAAEAAIREAAAACSGNQVEYGELSFKADQAIDKLPAGDAGWEMEVFENQKMLYGCGP